MVKVWVVCVVGLVAVAGCGRGTDGGSGGGTAGGTGGGAGGPAVVAKGGDAGMGAVVNALEAYKKDNGKYPRTEEGLKALVVNVGGEPRWRQELKEVPKDAWGREYVYRCPGQRHAGGYDLSSKGKDGQEGTGDDVGN